MLPLKLILKGLYSYQEEQVIDFTKLTEAKLFGIFGQVGSGKSSILEAISFALYGETERLNLRDNRSYNMMNLKCGELFIDYTFLAGRPEIKYRCVVSCKRHKTIFEKVPSIERKAYKNINEQWIPIELSQIEEAIGLSYENFRRTIIIPQGKFSEFLQLGDKDRTEMLKEIFKLERFEYSHKVASLEKKNNEKINILHGRLDQLGEISIQEIETQRSIRTAVYEDSKKLNQVLEEKTREEKELSHLKELFDKLNTVKDTLDKLQKEKQYYEELEKKIKRYEHCLIHFKPLIDLKKEGEKKIKVSESDLIEINKGITISRKNLLDKQREFASIERRFQDKDSLKSTAEELEKVIIILGLEKEIEELQKRVINGQALVDTVQRTIESTTEKRGELRHSIVEKKSLLPDLTVLKEINNWFVFKKNFEENIRSINTEITDLQIILEKTIHPSLRIIPEPVSHLFNDDEKTVAPKDFSVILKDKKEELSIHQENISREIESVVIQSKLESFASGLKPDDPCPLCGSQHHPNKLNIESVGFKIEALRNKRHELAESYKKFEELIASEQARIIKIQNINEQIAKEKRRLELENKKLETHISKFTWEKYKSLSQDEIEALFEKGQKIQQELIQLEEVLEKTLNTIEDNQKNKEKYTLGLNQLNISLSNKKAEQATYKSQLKVVQFAQLKDKPNTEIKKQILTLKEEYNHIVSQFEHLSSDINNLNQELARLEGKLEETFKHKKELSEEYERNVHLLTSAISSSEFHSIQEIEEILSHFIDIEKETLKIQNFQHQLNHFWSQLREIEVETADKEYKEEYHRSLLKNLVEQKDLIAQANKELGRLDNLLKTLEQNLTEKNRMLKEMEEHQLRKEDLNVLKQLFKASGFVNYVSSIFLKNLCNAANERFYKLTRQKLRLELTENNNFQIRDFLNNGQVRSVKTLSGGQTFQASLSLALALAESVQQQNKSPQNFFFLDEGFGSQDKESLNIVFETLKSLRKENRIVGIISHVNELQQEIDVYLNVLNTEERGSHVKGSWER